MPRGILCDHWLGSRVALIIGPILLVKFLSKRGDAFPCVKASVEEQCKVCKRDAKV